VTHREGEALGAKSDVYDCLVTLLLFRLFKIPADYSPIQFSPSDVSKLDRFVVSASEYELAIRHLYYY